MDGLSGKIKFDGAGFRSDFKLDIVELKREGLVQVGVWDPSNGANFTRNYTKTSNEVVESLHNKTLIVSTILVGGGCMHLYSIPSIFPHLILMVLSLE